MLLNMLYSTNIGLTAVRWDMLWSVVGSAPYPRWKHLPLCDLSNSHGNIHHMLFPRIPIRISLHRCRQRWWNLRRLWLHLLRRPLALLIFHRFPPSNSHNNSTIFISFLRLQKRWRFRQLKYTTIYFRHCNILHGYNFHMLFYPPL